jgi:hypothetical protein
MNSKRLFTDEHIPGSVVSVLRSLGHDLVRSKETFPEGTDDNNLPVFSAEYERIVLTADKQFTVVDGAVVTEHAGVIYVDQSTLHRRPEDAGEAVDRILSQIPPDARYGNEFYLSHWIVS